MKEEWICGFCLEVVEAEDRPEFCQQCKMCRCRNCNTRLKNNADFCFGCGTINPEKHGRMLRTSQTAVVYAQQEWKERGLPHGQTHAFVIMSGWHEERQKYDGVFLAKEEGSIRTDIRELTNEERVALGYKIRQDKPPCALSE